MASKIINMHQTSVLIVFYYHIKIFVTVDLLLFKEVERQGTYTSMSSFETCDLFMYEAIERLLKALQNVKES